MKRTAFLVFYLSMFACSEPFTFDTKPGDVIVVDALVSTIEGQSFVNIYQIENEEQNSFDDLDVRIVNGDGQQFEFAYNSASSLYQPMDVNFVGLVGQKYKLEASSAGEIVYSSSYDSISDGFNFDISAENTTVTDIVGSSNQLVEKAAVAAIANIPVTEETFYSKFEFSYSYTDFWSQMVEVTFPDEFVLYTNLNVNNPQSSINIPIGLEIRAPWIFYDEDGPSDICVPNTRDGCGEDPCCGNPCCRNFDSWLVEFRITQEALSPSTFQFWENVEKLRKNDGLVFDTYPFPLEGNVTCTNCEVDVVGLFRAVSESVQTVEVIL